MGIDHDKIRKARAGGRGGRGWRPKNGPNTIVVLPPHTRYMADLDSVEDFSIMCGIHYFKIEGRRGEASRCLEDLGRPCPACIAWRTHRKSSDPVLAEMAAEIKMSEQHLFNILDVNDLEKGVQAWGANWTCWDGIMDIGGNPQWGDVIDPTNAVQFTVTLTPGTQTRTGRNTYSITPNPNRVNIMSVLEAFEDWREKMDALVDNAPEEKTVDEILGLLREIGLPEVAMPGATRAAAASPPSTTDAAPTATSPVASAAEPSALSLTPAAGAPGPVAAAPVGSGAATPLTLGASTAAPAEPMTLGEKPEAPTPTPATTAAPAAPAPTPVHYDPGVDYVNPLGEPVEAVGNVPRCLGDYRPELHLCPPCPALSACQKKNLGVSL